MARRASQRPMPKVCRKKPGPRCAIGTKASGRPRSSATILAILFSKPFPCASENGKLSGSTQTRNGAASARHTHDVAASIAALMRQRENIERSAFGNPLLEIADCRAPAVAGGGVTRVEVVGDHRAGPAADPGEDRHIFMSVRPAKNRRLPDNAGVGLEL